MTYTSPSTLNMSKGFTELLYYTNEVTSNWVSNMMLIAVYILVLMGYYKSQQDFAGALAIAGFSTFVIALLFWMGGFVTSWALGITIGMTIIGVIVSLADKG